MSISHRPYRLVVALAVAGAALIVADVRMSAASASPFPLLDLLMPSSAQRFASPNDPAAQPPSYLVQPGAPAPSWQPMRLQPSLQPPPQPASLQSAGSPPNVTADTASADEGEERAALPRLQRQVVDYPAREAPGTIVIDTPNTYLYYVLAGGKAIRYGIGVGREGFAWSGVQAITRKAEWPDWTPPEDMIRRQPYLPRFMAGGRQNPLGARAMYLGSTMYRIHGTNAPSTIGGRVSSGCIRLTNEDVIDLFAYVKVGTKVVVLPMTERRASAGRMPQVN